MTLSKTFSSSLLLINCLFFAGCNNKNNNNQSQIGSFYKLTVAYNNGFLNRNDLLNIAYHYNSYSNINDSDFVPHVFSMDDLDEETITLIKKSHLKRIESDSFHPSIEDVSICNYYGTYNNIVVIRVLDKYILYDPLPPIEEYIIDGVKFLNYVEGYPSGFEVWKIK